MESIDLYKFIKQNHVELRWDGECLSTWIDGCHISEFSKLVHGYLSDEPMAGFVTKSGFIYIDLVPVCEHYGIAPESIFPK